MLGYIYGSLSGQSLLRFFVTFLLLVHQSLLGNYQSMEVIFKSVSIVFEHALFYLLSVL